MNNDILIQFTYLKEQLDPTIHNEYSLITEIFEELKWREKTDEEKWKSRLGSVSMTFKWSNSPLFGKGKPVTDIYFLELVEVSKIIVSILNILKEQKNGNLIVLRLKALLLIEKQYIDEFFEPKRHLPKNFFLKMLDIYKLEIKDIILIAQIEKLKDAYSKMYDSWDEVPQ